jgi:ribosomal protein S18 acetylase RimI-like enzyme
MSEVSIRPAELKDAPQIAKVHVRTWQCAYKGQMPDSYLDSLSIEKRTESWQHILSNPNSKDNAKTFVALINDEVVGFCSVGHCRDDDMPQETGQLWSLYVDQESMGKGVGTALQEKGLSYLREAGYKKAILWVLASNEKTREWYENKGWKTEGKTKVEVRDDFELHEIRCTIDL